MKARCGQFVRLSAEYGRTEAFEVIQSRFMAPASRTKEPRNHEVDGCSSRPEEDESEVASLLRIGLVKSIN